MGFNFSGIAVNKNYKTDFDTLIKQWNWSLIFVEEINFEKASENWKEEGLCDVYFSEQGTLLFVNMDMCTEPWCLENDNTFTFVVSETSMAFNLNYCQGKSVIRSIMEVSGDRLSDTGDKLPSEEGNNDTSTIIWAQLEKVTGKSFWSIEPDEKAYRYKFSKERPAKVLEEENLTKEPVEPILSEEDYTKQASEIIRQTQDFVQENKDKKHRFGKTGYVHKTNIELSEKWLLELNKIENVYKVERIASKKFGTVYIIYFYTKGLSFFDWVKNLFGLKK